MNGALLGREIVPLFLRSILIESFMTAAAAMLPLFLRAARTLRKFRIKIAFLLSITASSEGILRIIAEIMTVAH